MNVKSLVAVALTVAFVTPAIAKPNKSAVRREAQSFCKEQGFEGADLKKCVRDRIKEKKKK